MSENRIGAFSELGPLMRDLGGVDGFPFNPQHFTRSNAILLCLVVVWNIGGRFTVTVLNLHSIKLFKSGGSRSKLITLTHAVR